MFNKTTYYNKDTHLLNTKPAYIATDSRTFDIYEWFKCCTMEAGEIINMYEVYSNDRFISKQPKS